ncbi:MAG: hypothetical protein MJ090_01795 [Clostridia bacterium]|nr:hypothetical protein [Clostridia bacterium]
MKNHRKVKVMILGFIKNNFRVNIDHLILTVLLLQVVIIKWISYKLFDLVTMGLVVVIFFVLFRQKSFLKTKTFAVLFIFLSYQFLNFLVLGGSLVFLMRNAFRTFKSLIILLYITNLLKNKKEFLFDYLDKILPLLNIYAVINIPFLLLQRAHIFRTTTLSSLLGFVSYNNSEFYSKDMMSGFFGLYGTPCLAIFITFILLFNLYRILIGYNFSLNKRTLFTSFLFLFYLWMATQNDNKGYFIVIILFAFTVIITIRESRVQTFSKSSSEIVRRRLSNLFSLFVLLIAVILFGYYIYSNVKTFKDIVDFAIRKVYEGVIAPKDGSYQSVKGGGERFAMILYALSDLKTAIIGEGLGNYVYTSGNLGFAHFGQADVGTFICLGGSVYIFLMFSLIYSAFKRTFGNRFISLVLLLAFFALSCYTHVFMDVSITTSIMFIYVTIYRIYFDKRIYTGRTLK